MILILLTSIIVIIAFSKIKLKFYFNNMETKLTLILFTVIKIDINAKAIESAKKLKSKTIPTKVKVSVMDNLILIVDILKKSKYLFSKADLNLNIDCTYFIISPDKTAIIYGLMNAFLYNLENILVIILKDYKSCYNIKPDFEYKNNTIKIDMSIATRIIYILIFVIKLLPILKKYKRIIKSKGGEVNGSSNRGVNENYNG